MTLTMGLRRSLALDGGAEALVSEETRLSRREFVDRVARLAAALRNLGMRDGDRVAMLAANGHRYVEFYFGVLWGGGVIVPINSRFALAEMIEQARDAEPAVLIVDDAFTAMAEELAKNVPSIAALVIAGNATTGNRAVKSIGYEDALGAAKPIADAMRKESDLACLFYTGGTTGRSKGVMLSHGNLWANAMATIAHLGLDEGLVHLHSGPLFHLGAGARVYTTAVAGGKHVVVSRFTPQQALATIAREKVTVATFVPTMLACLELPDLEPRPVQPAADHLRRLADAEPVLQECLRRRPRSVSPSPTNDRTVAGCDHARCRHHMPGTPGQLRPPTWSTPPRPRRRYRGSRIAARQSRRNHRARTDRDGLLAQA
jgi:long-chain acyl-CoA synthetase